MEFDATNFRKKFDDFYNNFCNKRGLKKIDLPQHIQEQTQVKAVAMPAPLKLADIPDIVKEADNYLQRFMINRCRGIVT